MEPPWWLCSHFILSSRSLLRGVFLSKDSGPLNLKILTPGTSWLSLGIDIMVNEMNHWQTEKKSKVIPFIWDSQEGKIPWDGKWDGGYRGLWRRRSGRCLRAQDLFSKMKGLLGIIAQQYGILYVTELYTENNSGIPSTWKTEMGKLLQV